MADRTSRLSPVWDLGFCLKGLGFGLEGGLRVGIKGLRLLNLRFRFRVVGFT